MAVRYKIGNTGVAALGGSKTSKMDLNKLLSKNRDRNESEKPNMIRTDTRGITNPMMEDAASVLNTFYGGDPVLQGFLQMLSSARK